MKLTLLILLSTLYSLNSHSLSHSNSTNSNSEIIEKLILRRDAIKKWAPTCKGQENLGQYSESTSKCKQGDMTIFAWLGCIAAYLGNDQETQDARCRDVKLSQGNSGQWLRGPIQVDKVDKQENAFSRDQLRGLSAYFTVKGTILNPDIQERKDVQNSALNWVNWMDKEQKVRMCSGDNRCSIRSGGIYHTLFAMNVMPTKKSKEYKRSKTFKKMR